MVQSTNKQIELAYDYVQYTNRNIFLTGKAGTGKTTFLRRIKEESIKRTVVVAPTGVAAINAGGMTIHSFFQLSFGLFLPNKQNEAEKQRKFSRKKIDLIKSLDLLIIDEISMVRADLLDAVDEVLRRLRRSKVPFGGVQLLMIGDLHQLPPVVKPNEWNLMREHYSTPYFFGSLALKATQPISIKLTHIYRQSDPTFIELLNKVRNNQLDQAVLEQLNSRYIPNFVAPADKAYIILTSHNRAAQDINQEKLAEIDRPIWKYEAEVEGNFAEKNYPTEEVLELRKGAQVMFVKNDLSFKKRYYNGKIGQITQLEKDRIYVQCPDDEEEIQVNTEEWTNVKYTLDASTKEVQEEIVGLFRQYPLKLAWAITIHKSQGLTFERAIIDAQAAFAHGQVYVALSRCKSFEGIVLRTKIEFSSVRTDSAVKNYSKSNDQNAPTEQDLKTSKKQYQEKLMLELFDFKAARFAMDDLLRQYKEHERSLTTNALNQVLTLRERSSGSVFGIAQKFEPQLQKYFKQNDLPEENEVLQDRLKKGSVYFLEQLEQVILPELRKIPILTDNQSIQKRVKEIMERLEKRLFIKISCFQALKEKGFDAQNYIKIKTNADLNFVDFQRKLAAKDKMKLVPAGTLNPELYAQLLHWRSEVAEERDVREYEILPTKTLLELVEKLPTEQKTLKKIKGIGYVKIKQYGADLIKMIDEHCLEKGIQSNLMTSTPKKDTKKISFELFESGKDIAAIAKERGLVEGTIEGHLAHFIKSGELEVTRIVEQWKVEEIESYFNSHEHGSLSEVREFFKEKYSYGELRMVLAAWKRKQEE
ncbi:MAG: helix-turn-helix domain-containing protein [Bacteroidota bacterium]